MSENWLISLDDESYTNALEGFKTAEEAINHVKAMKVKDIKDLAEEQMVDVEGKETINLYVARRVDMTIAFDVSTLLDALREDASDFNWEYSQDFLTRVTVEQQDSLEKYLVDAVKRWMKETDNEPHFFSVDNTYELECKLV